MQPTLTIRPGYPVRVIVSKDLVLRPYQPLFIQTIRTMTTKLRLGPVPKAQPVKITITVTAELKETLDRYADVHSPSTGEKNDVERLIPYMLEDFMAKDRAFQLAARRALPDK